MLSETATPRDAARVLRTIMLSETRDATVRRNRGTPDARIWTTSDGRAHLWATRAGGAQVLRPSMLSETATRQRGAR